mgnify:CR=1 FL=1|tara:strand:- start:199 stop:1173 length:975 start_codon:yes stop_codon:yes gene_type:complete
MKRLIVVIFIVALIPVPAASQVPTPGIQWSADWVIDQNVAIMELDSETYQFELILEFWIDNERITPIEVSIAAEFEEVDFEVDEPGPVSVDGNSNETFELKIIGSGIIDGGWALYNADEFSETITLTLSETNQINPTVQEFSQDLEFSQLYEIHVEYEAAGLTSSNAMLDVKAGTSESINLQVFNYGNSDDAITKYSVSVSKCPQLKYNFEKIGELPLAISPATNPDDGIAFGTLEITASSTHPTKECELEFSVYSEATGRSSYATLYVDVEATENKDDSEEESSQDSESSDSSNLESESSSLPAISSGLCMLTVLCSAVIRRK